MPVRSWVLPGDTADVTTVARIKEDLRAWRLGRCVFVGDAGMYSAENLAALSRGLGRYILAVPMRRERKHREQVLAEIAAELTLLEQPDAAHPKAACTLLASRRYGSYLSTDASGRPRLDAAKVRAAEKFDGKFVVISNDDTLSAEDIALGYKGAWIIEACFRRMKQTGLEVRPVFHWTTRRIEAHVKLCVLALQVQRAAEIWCQLPWAQIAHRLGTLKAVRYRSQSRCIVQRTRITPELAELLKKLGQSAPKQILALEESSPTPAAA